MMTFVKQFLPPIIFLLSSMFIGIMGYHLFDSKSVIDSLYITIITMASIDFDGLYQLSSAGKIFTVFLIIASYGNITYSISTFISVLTSKEFKGYIKKSKMERKINNLRDHIVVCGFGRNGRSVINSIGGHDVVVIEKEENRLEETGKVLSILGDSTDEDILSKSNLQHAKALITTLPKDQDNVYVAMTAREINPNLIIISRASEEQAESILKRAGVNHVIMPEKIGGEHMSYLITKPDILKFVNLLTDSEHISFEEIDLSKYPNLDNVTLRQLDIRHKTGINIMGIKSHTGEFIVNPGTTDTVTKNCKLIAFGTKEQMNNLKKYFKDFKITTVNSW